MSALPPKADVFSVGNRCLLCPKSGLGSSNRSRPESCAMVRSSEMPLPTPVVSISKLVLRLTTYFRSIALEFRQFLGGHAQRKPRLGERGFQNRQTRSGSEASVADDLANKRD